MTFRYSDDEIFELLLRNIQASKFDIDIDDRAFNYWKRAANGILVLGVDSKYERFQLKCEGYGDVTSDYWVKDTRNLSFSANLDEFILMDERGMLPEEASPEQYRKQKLKKVIRIEVAMALAAIYFAFVFIFFV